MHVNIKKLNDIPDLPAIALANGIPVSELRLERGEEHPIVKSIVAWLNSLPEDVLLRCRQKLIEEAVKNSNREALLCLSTLERLFQNKPVSDRYLMALGWALLVLLVDK